MSDSSSRLHAIIKGWMWYNGASVQVICSVWIQLMELFCNYMCLLIIIILADSLEPLTCILQFKFQALDD